MIKITLPFPVSINSMFGGGSGQRRFPSKKYKQWLKSCPQLEPLHIDSCKIDYFFYFPDNRERDSQNYEKSITDYLVRCGVLKNDSWREIKEMRLIPVEIDRVNPRVEIIIYVGEES